MPRTEYIPALDEHGQVALLSVMFALIEADLGSEENRIREAVRGRLRLKRRDAAPDAGNAVDPVDIESPKRRQALLRDVTDERQGLLIAVEAAAYEPWAGLAGGGSGRLGSSARRGVLEETLQQMRTSLRADHLPAIDKHVRPRLWRRARQGFGPRQGFLVAGGVLAGCATAGIAAPAIGAAIGGSMGLTGAAATSAGLAWLGGGSIASGGVGMAGGTALLTMLGGAGIGGATGLTAQALNREQVKAEKAKLAALLHVGRAEVSPVTANMARDIEITLEREIARLLSLRADAAAADDDQGVRAVTEELAEVVALRRESSPNPFDLTLA